ncbi:MAG: thioredoxin-like domain-containing protein [Fluviicola sp.]
MKQVLALLLVLMGYQSQAQKIHFKVEGQEADTVHLVKYFGKNLFYADTAVMENGSVTFDGSKQKAGLLALYIPNQNLLEFIYSGEEDIDIRTKGANFMQNAEVKKSEENKLFFGYVQMIGTRRPMADQLRTDQQKHENGSKEWNDIQNKIEKLNQEVEDYRNDLVENHGEMLATKILKMSFEVEVPDEPVNEEGEPLDKNFRYKYYKEHYWDNIDLTDERLVRTKIFGEKLDYYFSKKMLVQHWDSIIVEAFDFIDQFDLKSDYFQYCVSTLTNKYSKSNIMGMNKVYVYLGKRYFCGDNTKFIIGDRVYEGVTGENGESAAHWTKESQRLKLCENVNTHFNLVMGATPPNIKLRDTTNVQYHDFMSLDNEYKVLYFWDPECGHCKKITPKLQTLYEKKWKDRNIEVFAVGKADSEELFEKWKKFIVKHNLEFINVALTYSMKEDAMDETPGQPKLRKLLMETTLESLNYQQQYDIFATPKVWILNDKNEIIAYSLTVSQLEDLFDKVQGVEDAEKIFPPEKNQEDEQMH